MSGASCSPAANSRRCAPPHMGTRSGASAEGASMFRIKFFPAQQGDAIWIEYASNANKPYRILIEAGTPSTAPAVRAHIENLPQDDRRFDLMVVTHVDTDHIGGVLKLLSDLPAGTSFDDVWFNGWPQIRNAKSSRLGPID